MKKSILIISLIMAAAVSCKKSGDAEPLPATETVAIGGKEYATRKIGNQTWTIANYEGAGGITFDTPDTKPAYGKYYSLGEMKAIVLPTGWRVPSTADFKELAATAGVVFDINADNTAAIKKLTAKTDWLHVQGTNTLGFNAYPGSYIVEGLPPASGDNAEFWTTDNTTFSLMEHTNQTTMLVQLFIYNNNTTDRFNIRFVKN